MRLARQRAADGEPCGICGEPIDMSLPQWFVDPKDGNRKYLTLQSVAECARQQAEERAKDEQDVYADAPTETER